MFAQRSGYQGHRDALSMEATYAAGGGPQATSMDLIVANIADGSTRTSNASRNSMTSEKVQLTCMRTPVSLRSRVAQIAPLQAVIFVIALFVVGVSAQGRIVFNVPQDLSQCNPVNLTWSGGAPPYRLDILPFVPNTTGPGSFDPVNRHPDHSLAQRFINIPVQYFIWTPNFTVPNTDVQFSLIDGTTNAPAGGHHVMLAGSTACLNISSTSPSASDSMSSPTLVIPISTAEPSPQITQLTQAAERHGLSTGAIAGIAAAIGVLAIVLTALAVWCCLRRRRRVKQHDFDVDRSVVAASPALSDSSTAVMHERFPSISNTLSKDGAIVTCGSPTPTDSHFASYSGPSSPSSETDPALRPTPYLVSNPSASPVPSLADLRKSRKSARDTLATTASANVSMTDVRSSTPTQMSETGSSASPPPMARQISSSPLSSPLPSPRTIRFETDGGVRLAVGESTENGPEDALSDSGLTAPPPYARYD